MQKRAITMVGAAFLSALMVGCSPNPTRIDPKPVPVMGYTSMSCTELSSLHTVDVSKLQTEDVEQRSARRSDAWGVLLLGLPVGRMAGGNRADEIAELKGEIIAIGSTFRSHHCTGVLVGNAS